MAVRIDLAGNISYANQAFMAYAQYSPSDLLGQPYDRLWHPDVPAAISHHLWDTLLKGDPWSGVIKNRTQNGEPYWIEACVVPIKKQGETMEYICVFTPPSHQKIKEAEAEYTLITRKGAVRQERGFQPLHHFSIKRAMLAGTAFVFITTAVSAWFGIKALEDTSQRMYALHRHNDMAGLITQGDQQVGLVLEKIRTTLQLTPNTEFLRPDDAIDVGIPLKAARESSHQLAATLSTMADNAQVMRNIPIDLHTIGAEFPALSAANTVAILHYAKSAQDLNDQAITSVMSLIEKGQFNAARALFSHKISVQAKALDMDMAKTSEGIQKSAIYLRRSVDDLYDLTSDRLIYWSLMTALIVGLFSFIFFRETMHPLQKAVDQMKRIAQGDLNEIPDVFGFGEPGQVTRTLAIMQIQLMMSSDELHKKIKDLTQTESDLRVAASAFESHESMMITDPDRVILRVNQAFVQSTGYSAEEVLGRKSNLLRSDRHDPDFYRDMWEATQRTGGCQGEVWVRKKDGEVRLKLVTLSAVKTGQGVITHYIVTYFDISQRKKDEERITQLAFYDQLTGLANRTLLLDRLKQAMASSMRSSKYGVLLFIDLDNFKTLNDTLGHDMGDLLLKQVGQRLTACVRAEDTVARLGGDEFVLVLMNLSEIEEEAHTEVQAIGEKILSALRQFYQLRNVAYQCTPSVGATLFKGDAAGTDELMKQADLAMYKSKSEGRNALHFFDPDMAAVMLDKVAKEADLRAALLEQQFSLHYQAQVDGEGEITGAEALARWQHPQRGMVSPAEFIPLAEETDLILPLGLWVLESACEQLAQWAQQPHMAHLTLAVNISAIQLKQFDFVEQVLSTIGKTGANPHRLKLELTESLFVKNMDDVIAKMKALQTLGVRFSQDDFGTGYSSLSYLKRLPLDQLKIDQSFVRDILTDPNDAAIAEMVVVLAKSLGLSVIAEGVETVEQRDFLAQLGCHNCQGYLISRPLPLAAFNRLVETGVDFPQSNKPAISLATCTASRCAPS